MIKKAVWYVTGITSNYSFYNFIPIFFGLMGDKSRKKGDKLVNFNVLKGLHIQEYFSPDIILVKRYRLRKLFSRHILFTLTEISKAEYQVIL